MKTTHQNQRILKGALLGERWQRVHANTIPDTSSPDSPVGRASDRITWTDLPVYNWRTLRSYRKRIRQI